MLPLELSDSEISRLDLPRFVDAAGKQPRSLYVLWSLTPYRHLVAVSLQVAEDGRPERRPRSHFTYTLSPGS